MMGAGSGGRLGADASAAVRRQRPSRRIAPWEVFACMREGLRTVFAYWHLT